MDFQLCKCLTAAPLMDWSVYIFADLLVIQFFSVFLAKYFYSFYLIYLILYIYKNLFALSVFLRGAGGSINAKSNCRLRVYVY